MINENVKDIVIYGTGAIGSVVATFLQASNSERNKTIHLVGRKHILDKIKDEGLTFIPYKSSKDSDQIHTSEFQVYTHIAQVPRADVIFFTLKAHSLEESLKDAESILKNDPVVFLTMNGLGLKDIAEKYVIPEHIIQCVVLFPSKLEGNKVSNTGGNSKIIVEKTPTSEKIIPKLFQPGTLDIALDKDCITTQWTKAVMNIGMNAISAITMKTVGEVLETEPLRKIISQLIHETVQIAEKKGIKLPDNMEATFWDFCSKDPNHRPSTQQDLLRNKPTETPFLNGYICQMGRKYGISTPANDSISTLMEIIEGNSD